MLNFNSRGYLEPDRAIDTTLEELKKVFVNNYTSNTRLSLYRQYQEYSSDLKAACQGSELRQWIDGSFVTKRKQHPADIDMVTFIDAFLLNHMEKDQIKRFTYPHSKQNYPGIDAYIVETYAPSEDKYSFYQSDCAWWLNHFTKTRRNRWGRKECKGFLEIVY